MGDLTVVSTAKDYNPTKFTVKCEGNFTISNTKNKNNLDRQQYRVDVKNGNASVSFCRPAESWMKCGDKYERKEVSLGVRDRNYQVFDAIRQADKKDKGGKILNRADLDALRNDKELQKKLGVQVKYDPNEKVYGIYRDGSLIIHFDFE